MATQKVWNVKFVVGNPKIYKEVKTDQQGPFRKGDAVERATVRADKGWRAWVEHTETKKRIFESDVEKEFLEEDGYANA
ncbi:hypothetical protein [Salinimonas chungwhensis]|uniref:hypothetical protein n=1 Tax=Salinimonas chungwhensis TaxID=265425 RepID=UPI00035D330F|nr:hypothetical protein [Salinimonas chungwhensis]